MPRIGQHSKREEETALRIRNHKDFWSGLMFVVIGTAFAFGATSYSFGRSANPGPGYFPFGLGVLLALLGAIIIFKSLVIETEDGGPIGRFAWRPLLIILGAIALFGFTLERLGLAIALPLLIIVSGLASDEFRWKGTLVSAVILTVGSYLVFIKGLGLIIPLWPAFLG
jgi:hypothetical protein